MMNKQDQVSCFSFAHEVWYNRAIMAKKRKKSRSSSRSSRKRSSGGGVQLSDGMKQSLFALAVILVALMALLGHLGQAGDVGEAIDGVLALLFGWDRFMFSLALLVFGIMAAFPKQGLVSWNTVAGLSVLFLGLNGISNLVMVDGPGNSEIYSEAGGYIGLIVSQIIAGPFGTAGAAVVAIVLMVVGIILIFNVGLHELLAIPATLFKKKEETVERVEDREAKRQAIAEAANTSNEDVFEVEEVEDEIEESAPKKKRAVPVTASTDDLNTGDETVMTSKERRLMSIPIDLLDEKSSEAKSGDVDAAQEVIENTFKNFNIEVEMKDVRVGPSVTQYAFKPALGVKLSRIVALQNDLALALAAHPIRIEAPIPGKALVGIEVPNETIGMVGLRELLISSVFKNRKSDLTAPLGKDVGGLVTTFGVDSAPHCLVAGATGSGKSVCLNTIIVSLLYQNGPDDLKFIFVDPKRVELGRYAGIPHLLVPPIVKVDEAINALKWGVREMERRLDHLAKFGARDIDSYNKKSEERMPKIVIVIDELADLMSQNKRDVEAVIVRIAQMARAAGIHLVLATQRPSVDVITGTIKANIPTRLAFAVASQVDSKTMLDVSGAEKLLGRGDMLISSPKHSKPKRLQGAFVSDEEIERIVNFLKKEGEPDYNYQVTEEARVGGTAIAAEDADDMLEEAIQTAIEAGKVSTSYLQRRLRIGYSRAASIVDMMEEMGVIGPQNGSKPREILVTEWPPQGASESAEEETAEHSDDEELYDEELEDLEELDEELDEELEN